VKIPEHSLEDKVLVTFIDKHEPVGLWVGETAKAEKLNAAESMVSHQLWPLVFGDNILHFVLPSGGDVMRGTEV